MRPFSRLGGILELLISRSTCGTLSRRDASSVLKRGLPTFALIAIAAISCADSAPTETVEQPGVEVVYVQVAPASATVEEGEAARLAASPVDALGHTLMDRAVSWTVADPAVAGVDAAGNVVGLAEGTTTVSATADGRAGTASIRVLRARVETITLSPSSVSLAPGQTALLAAELLDRRGRVLSGRVVSWTSANTGVATVGQSGLVSGVAAGSALITASSEGRSASAIVTVTSTVTPPAPAASVAISPSTIDRVTGQTASLSATVRDVAGNVLSGRVVTWSSSAPGIATVNANGLVVAVAPGAATISATCEGVAGTALVNVAAAIVPVASVGVSPTSSLLSTGQTAQLTATPRDAAGNPLSGRAVTWTTSAAAVATVSASGLVTGIATGNATISATSEGQSGSAAITVTVVPVASVTMTPANLNLQVGAIAQVSATPRDAAGNALTGRAITWSTTAAGVATVNSTGTVTAVGAGSATIRATSEGQIGSTATTVTVVPVASVSVAPATPSINVGQTVQLSATPRDAGGNALTGRPVTWGTGAPAVATVSASGLVTAIAAGNATISATSEGQSGSSVVTVSMVPVATVGMSPASLSLQAGQTSQITATPRDAAGNALTGRVITWTTTAATVATVNSTGLVTAVAAGTATIRATSEGQVGSTVATIVAQSGGAAAFFTDDFESTAALGGGQGPGDARWGDICCTGGPFTVVNPSSLGFAAFSGTRVLRIGTPGGAMTHWFKSALGGTTLQSRGRVAVSMRLYVPSAWSGTIRFLTVRGSRDPWGSFGIGGVCPIDRPPATEFVSASINASSALRMYTYWLGMDRQSGQPWTCTGTNGMFANDTPKATYHNANYLIPRNQWLHVEMELIMNSVGQADGSQRIWVNGTPIVDHLGVTYRRDALTMLQALTIDSGSIPAGQVFYIDDVIVKPQR